MAAVALIGVRLGREGLGDDGAINPALHAHLVEDKTRIALADIALHHSRRVLRLLA